MSPMGSVVLYLLGALAAFSIVAYVAFLAFFLSAMRAMVRTDDPSPVVPANDDLPPVSVLKPCAGLDDDDLEACLESYCRTVYPRVQFVFGVRDARDLALPVIQRVIARHPELDAAIAVGSLGHASPKVDNLAVCASRAKYPLFWASDSNTRVSAYTLAGMVTDLRAQRADVLVSPIAGDGECTVGSALEALHLCVFVTMAGMAVWQSVGQVAAAGKSCLIPSETLERVGGWEAIGRYHGDDVMLLKLARRAGLKPVLGRHVVTNVSRRASIATFLSRHGRWAQIRVRTVARAALFEPLMYPFAAPLAFAVAFPGMKSLAVLALALTLLGLGDACVVRAVRGPGRGLALRFWPLVWLRPLLLLLLWARALVDRRARWRGVISYVGRESEVIPATGRAVRLSRPVRTLP